LQSPSSLPILFHCDVKQGHRRLAAHRHAGVSRSRWGVSRSGRTRDTSGNITECSEKSAIKRKGRPLGKRGDTVSGTSWPVAVEHGISRLSMGVTRRQWGKESTGNPMPPSPLRHASPLNVRKGAHQQLRPLHVGYRQRLTVLSTSLLRLRMGISRGLSDLTSRGNFAWPSKSASCQPPGGVRR
jgi:hypothetical protein